jgi:RNA polymerase sigma factor (sigma-70 family)
MASAPDDHADLETDLMRRVAADEPGAFERLVDRMLPRLLGYLRRLGAGREEAEDLSQEVLLKVYRARRDYVAKARFATYLFHVARNCWIDFYRHRRVGPATVSTDAPRRRRRGGRRGGGLGRDAGRAQRRPRGGRRRGTAQGRARPGGGRPLAGPPRGVRPGPPGRAALRGARPGAGRAGRDGEVPRARRHAAGPSGAQGGGLRTVSRALRCTYLPRRQAPCRPTLP